jgi:HTH-type transcriptional regulator / antitoxin HigA
MMMDIRPIRTEADYDWALAEIERYFEHEPEPDTLDAARFDVLAALIDDYETKHWPVDPPDPIAAILYRMEQAGLEQADLGRLFGSRSRASEVLHRKRPLTTEQIFRLYREWHIPADVLIRPYHVER